MYTDPQEVQIFVRILDGRSIVLKVTLITKVKELKELVLNKIGIPIEHFRLTLGGRLMNSDRTLSEHNI